MAKLPDASALGERPVPQLPRRGEASMRAQTGFEQEPARVLAHAGNDLTEGAVVMAREKEQADTLAAEDAYNKLRSKQIDLTYGKDGFMNQRGADAVNKDLPVTYGKQFQSAAQEIAGGLSNDYQRQIFNRRASSSQMQLQELAFRHVSTEADVYAKEVLQGTLDVEMRLSAAGGDPKISLVRVNAVLDRDATRFGRPEQEVTAAKMKAADSIWSATIKGLIGRSPMAALEMFNEHQSELGPVNKPVLEHEITTAVQPIQAKAISDYVIGGRGPAALQKLQKTLGIGGAPELQKVSQQLDEESTAAPMKSRDTRGMLGEWMAQAERVANSVKPNDPVFRDVVEQQVRSHVAGIVAIQQGIQTQAQGFLLTTASGGDDGKGRKPTSLDQLLSVPGARDAFSKLDPQAAAGIRSLIDHNAMEAIGKPAQINARLEQQIFNRMVLPSNDPNAITNPTQLTPFIAQGLTIDGHSRLVAKLDAIKTSPEGRAFALRVDKVTRGAAHMMSAGIVGQTMMQAQPEKLAEAQLNFSLALDQKIEEYRKAGKNTSDLLTPGKPDYFATPENIMTFMPSAKKALSDAASKVKADAAAAEKPKTVNYVAGQKYKFKQGELEFLGGNPDLEANWRAAN